MENDVSTRDSESQAPLEGQLVRSRAWHAYQLKLAGLSLYEIADRLNFTSGGAVAKAIKDEMMSAAKDIDQETRETLLELEVERLNYAQSKIWLGVEAGDPKAIDALIKIITLRTRLQQVDQVDASAGVNTVLVVGGAEADYIERLKKLAGDETQAGR